MPEYEQQAALEVESGGLNRVLRVGIKACGEAVIAVGDGRFVIPAAAEIERQLAADLVVVLNEACVVMAGISLRLVVEDAAAVGIAQQETGEGVARRGAGGLGVLLRPGIGEADAAERRSRFALVVEHYPELRADLDGMFAEDLRQRLVPGPCAADVEFIPDIAARSEAGVIRQADGRERLHGELSDEARGNAEGGQIERITRIVVLPFMLLPADAGDEHEGGRERAGEVDAAASVLARVTGAEGQRSAEARGSAGRFVAVALAAQGQALALAEGVVDAADLLGILHFAVSGFDEIVESGGGAGRVRQWDEFRIARAMGFRRFAGMMLPGNAVRRYWPLVGVAGVVRGS